MKTKTKIFITAALALLLVLSVTGVVMATDLIYKNIPLHNDTAEKGTDCPADGSAYWHFVIAPNNNESGFIKFYLNLGDAAPFTTTVYVPNGGQWDNVFVAVPAGKMLTDLNKAGSSADIYWSGEKQEPDKFMLSHVCPAKDYEELQVSKTVVTTYEREHFWDIAKSVTPSDIYLYIPGQGAGKPSSGTATWEVDVDYKGYSDSGFNVSGVITIKNTGTLPAVITDITDLLAGTEIDVACSGDFYLNVGETLTCTYSEDGYVEGNNVVLVETEKATYTDTKAIKWGDPDKEINKTVTITDSMFGSLGTVTAPDGETFTYTRTYNWEDFGADKCGDHKVDNTATIVETGQFASASLWVHVQCYKYETAYARGASAICFIPTFSNWGWTNPILPGTYTWDLWAAAGQCDTSKGTKVGTVTVTYALMPSSLTRYAVTVTYNVAAPYLLKQTHVYAGYDRFPKLGKIFTVAPGFYTNMGPFNGSRVHVIAHAIVGLPDPTFGP